MGDRRGVYVKSVHFADGGLAWGSVEKLHKRLLDAEETLRLAGATSILVGGVAHLQVTGEREETDAEMAAREAQERERSQKSLSYRYSQYLKLKEEFEPRRLGASGEPEAQGE